MPEIEPSFIALSVDRTIKMTGEIRRSHCEDWRKSGLSMSEYCRRLGLSVSSLSGWLKKFHYAAPTKKKIKPEETISPRRQCMEIILVSGIRLRFSEIGNMSEIVRLLKAIESCN